MALRERFEVILFATILIAGIPAVAMLSNAVMG